MAEEEDYSIELALIRSVTRPPIAESAYAMSWRNGKRCVDMGRGGTEWILITYNRNIWTGTSRRRVRSLSFAELHEKITNPRFAKYWRIAPR